MARAYNLSPPHYTKEEDKIIKSNTVNVAYDILKTHIEFGKNKRSKLAIERRKTKLNKGLENYRFTVVSIVQLDKQLQLIRRHISVSAASKFIIKESKKQNPLDFRIKTACKTKKYTVVANYCWMYEKDFLSGKKLVRENLYKPKKTKIVKLTLTGRYIRTFTSITSASVKTGINRSGISDNCAGRTQSAGGFKWMYYHIYVEA